MTLFDYQDMAMQTCMETCENVSYMLFNLQGEVGEFSGKLAKLIRKGKVRIDSNKLCGLMPPEEYDEACRELKLEAGDILWQLAGLVSVMGWRLEDIAQMNLEKLASRKQRGVIDGNGDNR